jgi:hypothetical protein
VQNPNSNYQDEGGNECILYVLTRDNWQR